MNIKFSTSTLLLVISMAIEYIAIDVVEIYMALNYAVHDKDFFLVMIVPTITLVGPVFIGPVAGVITDRISERSYIVPLIAVAVWAPLVAFTANASILLQLSTLMTLSFLAYMSANIRIASSKFLVPKNEYTPYHGAVVWVLQVVPVFAPLLASMLISNPVKPGMLYGCGAAILFLGVVLFLLAQKVGEKTEAFDKNEADFKGMGSAIGAAARFICSDRQLSHSVIVAAFVNVVVFTSGYAGVAAFGAVELSIFGFNDALQSAPLVALGLGALVGSVVAGRVKSRYTPCRALEATMIGSVVLLLMQILAMTSLVSLLAITGIGIAGSITSILAWNMRLQRSRSNNIGTIAGLTGSVYKVPSLVFLPVIGWLAAVVGIQFACLLATVALMLLYLTIRQSAALRSQSGGGVP